MNQYDNTNTGVLFINKNRKEEKPQSKLINRQDFAIKLILVVPQQ